MNAQDRYARCEALVLTYEGGATYTNNPKDRGGPTKFGVTQAALSEYRGHSCSAEEVQGLTSVEAAAIYKAKYWAAVRGDDLPAGVDLIVFDAAVNTGRGRAAKLLQTALGVEADGAVGTATLRALASADDIQLIEKIRQARLVYYRSLPDFAAFGTGWSNRVAAVAHTAATWAARG